MTHSKQHLRLQGEFCFIIGYDRYTESREKAREPDRSVVQDPSVRSDRTKPVWGEILS